MADVAPVMPAHVEDTTRTIARLHAEHHRGSTPFQRGVRKVTDFVSRPHFMSGLTAFIAVWLGWNGALAPMLGVTPFDPPPFSWLQGLAQIFAVYVTVSILASQGRETEMADLRQQLTLELSILNEQKSAKIIALIEELRRDSANVGDRVDPEAEAMGVPNDPEAILAAIKDSHVLLAEEDKAPLASEPEGATIPV
jgi:uncharacterized membrane protein